jgi:hypothetical protein
MVAGPALSGTVSISGAATIPSTRFTVGAQMEVGENQTSPPPRSTCADYADGFAAAPGAGIGFVAPMLQTDGSHNIYVDVTITTGYHGPGAYESKGSPSLAGSAVEGIGSGASAVYTVFHSADDGLTTLIVRADGSGSLTITHWDSDEVRQVPGVSQVSINGLVTWTCSAPSPSTQADSTPEPCTFLTQSLAAQMTGDASMTTQGTDVAEPISGYVACILSDPRDEANNVSVQIKRMSGDVDDAMLHAAAAYFARGEPVQPYQPFTADGIGDRALGESTLGFAFIVCSKGADLVYVGAGSASVSVPALERSVESLATRVAAAL